MEKFFSTVFFFCLFFFSKLSALTTSIIVPCYPGHVKYIPELIEYYNNQTILPDEMVIALSDINNISEADRINVMQCKPKFFLKIALSEKVVYAGQNRNVACELATGDILICQDADDIPHHQRVEIIKKMFEVSNVDIILHRWVPTEKESLMQCNYDFNRIFLHVIKDWKHHKVTDYIHYGNVSICRQVLEKVAWTDQKNGEDTIFVFNCLNKGLKLGIIHAYLVLYRNELSSGN